MSDPVEFDRIITTTFVEREDFINVVQENFHPEDLFDEDTLDIWAAENGYTKDSQDA